MAVKSNNDYDGWTLALVMAMDLRYDDYAQWWIDGYNYYNNHGVEIDYRSYAERAAKYSS